MIRLSQLKKNIWLIIFMLLLPGMVTATFIKDEIALAQGASKDRLSSLYRKITETGFISLAELREFSRLFLGLHGTITQEKQDFIALFVAAMHERLLEHGALDDRTIEQIWQEAGGTIPLISKRSEARKQERKILQDILAQRKFVGFQPMRKLELESSTETQLIPDGRAIPLLPEQVEKLHSQFLDDQIKIVQKYPIQLPIDREAFDWLLNVVVYKRKMPFQNVENLEKFLQAASVLAVESSRLLPSLLTILSTLLCDLYKKTTNPYIKEVLQAAIFTYSANMLKRNHEGSLYDLVFSADGKFLVISGDKVIEVFELDTRQRYIIPYGKTRVAISPDSKKLVYQHHYGSFLIIDFETNKTKDSKLIPSGETTSIKFSPDGNYLIDTNNRGMDVFDFRKQKLLYTVPNVQLATISADSNTLVTNSFHENDVKLWNIHTGTLVNSFNILSSNQTIHSLTVTPDNNYICVGLANEIQIRDFKTGTLYQTLTAPHSVQDNAYNFSDIVIDPSGKSLYSIIENFLYVWDIHSGKRTLLGFVPGKNDYIPQLAGSTLLATGAGDSPILIWNFGDMHTLCKQLKI